MLHVELLGNLVQRGTPPIHVPALVPAVLAASCLTLTVVLIASSVPPRAHDRHGLIAFLWLIVPCGAIAVSIGHHPATTGFGATAVVFIAFGGVIDFLKGLRPGPRQEQCSTCRCWSRGASRYPDTLGQYGVCSAPQFYYDALRGGPSILGMGVACYIDPRTGDQLVHTPPHFRCGEWQR
jgi:hypothetical protein